MHRRSFTAGLAAAALWASAPVVLRAQSGGTYKAVRMRQTGTPGNHKPWNVKTIADPTGNAPTRKVDRFELRGGDCSNPGECKARIKRGEMNARTRIEKVFACDMTLGEEGLYRYSLYFPSAEHNLIDVIGTTFGQLLCAFTRNGEYDSLNVFSLDTDHYKGNWDLYASLSEVRFHEENRVRTKLYRVGSMRTGGYLDRWIDVQVRFKLSDQGDGYMEPAVDGRRLGRFTGPNMLAKGYPEVRYGLYQNHINNYPGGPAAMPPQVVYFSGVSMFRLT